MAITLYEWEIDEWGSTLDLGWLPFSEVEEIYASMYFISKDTTNYFITKDTANYFVSKGEL